MFGGGSELAMMVHKFLVIVGIGDALEIAAVDGLGLVMLGDGDGFEALLAGGDVDVAAHEVHEVGALQ